MSKNIVITGCSSGIGAATAELLKEKGWNVIATARKEDDLQRLRDAGFQAVELDIADADSTARAADDVLNMFDGRVDAVVNNAGYGQTGAIEDLSRETLRYQFEVNVFGMQDFTNRLIPAMRKQGSGRIINISSVLGRVSLPFMGSYSASKFAMEAMSDAMRVELDGSGIRVVLIEPGPIDSDFRVNVITHAEDALNLESGVHASMYRNALENRKASGIKRDTFTLPPEAVAKKILRALTARKPKLRYRVTVPAYITEFMRRVLPHAVVDWMMKKQVRKRK